MPRIKRLAYTLSAALMLTASTIPAAFANESSLDIKFAGALEFAQDGTLFVGDNYNGAVYAFEVPEEVSTTPISPSSLANIDTKIAELLGVGIGAIEINDMAAHPQSDDIYISVSRISNFASQPVIVKVSQDQQMSLLDLSSLAFHKQELSEFPSVDATFHVRGGMGTSPPLPRDVAKGSVALRSLAIMDLEYYNGELFVAGVAHDNFLSSLRRIPYPFDGSQSITNVDMYHVTHDQYESRAPIRAMSVQV